MSFEQEIDIKTLKAVIVDALLGPMPIVLPGIDGKVHKEDVAATQADVITAAITAAGMTVVQKPLVSL